MDIGHHQLRIPDLLFLHVAPPRINEANYFIISQIACRYTCTFSLEALLFVSRLSEHKQPGAIGTLKAGVRVLASPDIIIATRQLNSTSEIVTRLLGHLKVDTGLAN